MAENILRLAPTTPIRHHKHELTFDGHTYQLRLQATPCGVDIAYVRDRTEKELKAAQESPFISMINLMGPKEIILHHDHIHPKWWWPFLFRSTEGEIKRFITLVTKTTKEFEKNKDVVGKFLQ